MNKLSSYIPTSLEQQAVDVAKLSTNFIDIVSDCGGIEDFVPKNVLNDRFPLTSWLLGTSFARWMRERSFDAENFSRPAQDDDAAVIRRMDIPNSVWTLEPTATGENECCWTMPGFAKCASDVPLFGLCLKDCDNIFEDLFYRRLRVTSRQSLDGIARTGDTFKEVNERLMRLWMAFYTANTAVLGTSTTSDPIVKPFHGLVEVLENEAVLKIYGGNILAAFASLGCRLDVLGGDGYVIWVHPMTYNAIDSVVVRGQDGELPYGWARREDGLYFKGIRIRSDKLVPFDMEAGTGEAWLLAGDSVGLFLATNLMPEGDFVIRNDFTEQAKVDENGCARVCTYLYNYGAVANNNAQRLAVITDIPMNSACANAIGDLGGLINPNTLIPA